MWHVYMVRVQKVPPEATKQRKSQLLSIFRGTHSKIFVIVTRLAFSSFVGKNGTLFGTKVLKEWFIALFTCSG